MDSSNDEPVETYVKIADLFRRAGLRTPSIYKVMSKPRVALIEDLGDAVVARLLDQGADAKEIYECAIDNLGTIQTLPLAEWLPPYDNAFYRHELTIFLQFGKPSAKDQAVEDFWRIWDELLPKLEAGPRVVVHRDYHVENLIWLSTGRDLNRLGILDFQGARLGHPLYDAMSLLEDIRRPVPQFLREHLLQRYLEHHADLERTHAAEAYAILSAQRNLKILGLIGRWAECEGKLHYKRLMPRVAEVLERAFSHPSLAGLRAWYHDNDRRD